MFYINGLSFLMRNRYSYHSYMMFDNLLSNIKNSTANLSISDYSMVVNLHVKDRLRKYVTNHAEGILDAANEAYENPILFSTTSCYATIYTKGKTVDTLKSMLSNIFVTIVFFIFLLSFILYYSLVKSVSNTN